MSSIIVGAIILASSMLSESITSQLDDVVVGLLLDISIALVGRGVVSQDIICDGLLLLFGKLFNGGVEGAVFSIVSPPSNISWSKLSMCATPNILANSICCIICHVIDCSTGNKSKISPNRPLGQKILML